MTGLAEVRNVWPVGHIRLMGSGQWSALPREAIISNKEHSLTVKCIRHMWVSFKLSQFSVSISSPGATLMALPHAVKDNEEGMNLGVNMSMGTKILR